MVMEYKRIIHSNETCLPRHAHAHTHTHTNRHFEKNFQFSINNITYFRRLNLYVCGTIDDEKRTQTHVRKNEKFSST